MGRFDLVITPHPKALGSGVTYWTEEPRHLRPSRPARAERRRRAHTRRRQSWSADAAGSDAATPVAPFRRPPIA